MKYINIIKAVTTERGLRELVGNPIFERAEFIVPLGRSPLPELDCDCYGIAIKIADGWFESESTKDIVDRFTSKQAVTTGVSKDAKDFIKILTSQSYFEFLRTGDNPNDVERYDNLPPELKGEDRKNPDCDKRMIHTKEEIEYLFRHITGKFLPMSLNKDEREYRRDEFGIRWIYEYDVYDSNVTKNYGTVTVSETSSSSLDHSSNFGLDFNRLYGRFG